MRRAVSPDVFRIGTVSERDLAAGTVRVRVGEMDTAPMPWGTQRAGDLRIWSPPSVGEQVVIMCPEGDWEAALCLGALFSDRVPAPHDGAATVMAFDDGARFSYDAATHRLEIDLGKANGDILAKAPGGIRIEADIEIVGSVSVTEDVVADGVSLVDHVHSGVQAGSAISGKPVG